MTAGLAFLALALRVPPVQGLQQPKASIEGFVLRTETNEPLPRATVDVIRNAMRTDSVLRRDVVVSSSTTDDRGHFIVKDLDAGTYSVVAKRNGFVRQEYGERAPGRGGTPLNITAGQAVKDVIFRLIPNGAVSGRVTDPVGEPLPNMNVTLLKSRYDAEGRRTLQPAMDSVRSNDRGEYRIYSITPGRYFVSAGPDRDRLGFFAAGNDVFDASYAPAYYPGTTDPSAATAVEVQPGGDINAIDFKLSRQPLFRIRGRTFDVTTGQPPRSATVQLVSRTFDANSGLSTGLDSGNTGNFEMRNVPAGSYMIYVQSLEPPPGGSSPVRTSAQIPIEVSNDIENLLIPFSPGMSISGRISIEDGTPISSLPNYQNIRPYFSPVMKGTPGDSTPTASDGAFKIENLHLGEYRLNILRMPTGFYLKEAQLGEVDALSEVAITGPTSSSLEIVLSPNGSQIDATIVDKDRHPVSGVLVVLIPERQRARRDLYQTGASDQNGHFVIRAVAPGDYKLFAWEDLEPFAYYDPEIFRKYETRGVPVTLPESSRFAVEVKVIPAGQ